MSMNGNGVIVVRLDNSYNFHEHTSLQSARAEAHRLAAAVGGRFVVYVPVATVEPAPKTLETQVRVEDADDFPF